MQIKNEFVKLFCLNSPLAAAICLISSILLDVGAQPALALDNSSKQPKSTGFAMELFKREAADASKNVVISPFSAYMALSMATNGAVGETRSQMAKTIGAPDGDLDQFNSHNHALMLSLNKNTAVQLEIANALFADKECPFKQSFVDLCRNDYLSEARTGSFTNPATVAEINSWCDKKTHGKIKEIIKKFDQDEKLVLLNSVYFKGLWDKQFETSRTGPGQFKILGGGTKQVSMMHANLSCGYFERNSFSAISLPYKGGQQVMYVFLPTFGADLHSFLSSFNPANWEKWTHSFYPMDVELSMPKYRVAFENDFKSSLQAMGMKKAFQGAEFSAMCAKPVRLSRVIQKTYIEVDEKGTEAAAVTAVVGTFAALHQVKAFNVDHPFVVALADSKTNEILFLGSIVDPTLK